jgi:hypothetical protein
MWEGITWKNFLKRKGEDIKKPRIKPFMGLILNMDLSNEGDRKVFGRLFKH